MINERRPEVAPVRPFHRPGTATLEDFERLDIRVGRVVRAEPFPEARKPCSLARCRFLG